MASPMRRGGNVSPTPSDFFDEHQYTPSASAINSPIKYEDGDDSMEQQNMNISANPLDASDLGAINYSSSSEDGVDNAKRATLISPPPTAAALIHDPAAVLTSRSVAPSPAPLLHTDDHPQLVVHLFKPVSNEDANNAAEEPLRTHMQFTDGAAAEPAIHEVNIDELFASNDTGALRAHFEKMRQALVIEKSFTVQLENKTKGLEKAVVEQRTRADQEARRAKEAEQVYMQVSSEAARERNAVQPTIVKDGLPIALANQYLLRPVMAMPMEVDKENDIQAANTPQKEAANTSIAVTTPTRHYLVSPVKNTKAVSAALSAAASNSAAVAAATAAKSAAAKNLIKKNLYDPLVRTNKLAKSYARDVKEQLANFAQDMKESCKLIVGALMANDAAANEGTLLARYNAEKRKNRRLHDQLLEAQGNIRVFARIRPLMSNTATNASGGEAGQAVIASTNSHLLSNPNDAGRIVQEIEQDATKFIDEYSVGHSGKVFEFDKILHQHTQQEQVFAQVEPFLQSVVDGFSVAIFAYGQTGSGKTYTMDGCEGNEGVNPRALRQLFHLLNSRSKDEWEYKVKLSSVEIYNETPRDLLVEPGVYKKNLLSSSADAHAGKLEIHQNGDGGIYIPGLIEKQVTSEQEVMTIMKEYIKVNRSTAATSMNEYSSRSHSLIFLTVESTNKESEGERMTGKLVLIDLAGSERVKKSEAAGQALKEATYINKSLSALGDVISSLKNKASHIPFRNSKLTFLLSDVLGGSGKVLMFAQISPSVSDSAESHCTLQFASRVRKVELGPAKAKKSSNASLSKLLKAEQALAAKDAALEKATAETKKLREEMQEEQGEHLSKLAALQSTHAERVRQLEVELAQRTVIAAPTSEENDNKHLLAIIRAKDREIEKLSRNSGSQTQQFGTNLLDAEPDMSVSLAGSLSFAIDDSIEQAAAEEEVAESEAPVQEEADKENPPAAEKKRLSGSKRKDSPKHEKQSSVDISAAQEREDDNVAKKAKIGANTTPRTVLGSSGALNTSLSTSGIAKSALKVTSSISTAAGPTFKAAARTVTPKAARSKVAQAWAPKADATAAAAVGTTTSFSLDDSMSDSADVLSTPVGKGVRFGGVETKFISPQPPASATSAFLGSGSGSNLEALRVKRAAATTGKSMLGGAKRQVVKSHAAPAWNTSFK